MSLEELRRTRDARQRLENEKYGAPRNVACSWERAEDERLREEFRRGMTPMEIAREHERGEYGIRERLVALGLVDPAVRQVKAVDNQGASSGTEGAVPFGSRAGAAVSEGQGCLFEMGAAERYE